jgi:hypothetical protein
MPRQFFIQLKANGRCIVKESESQSEFSFSDALAVTAFLRRQCAGGPAKLTFCDGDGEVRYTQIWHF